MARVIRQFLTTADEVKEALPEMRRAFGVGLRKSDAGGACLSVYDHVRWQHFNQNQKATWKQLMPSSLVDTFLQATFVRLPASAGRMCPTTVAAEASTPIGAFLSIALNDLQNISVNNVQYVLDQGDAILFDVTDTYEVFPSKGEALWSVNVVPKVMGTTYG